MFRISRRYKIWKLQRPLYSNQPIQEIMAYTEDHAQVLMVPMIDYEMHKLFGADVKIYVLARFRDGDLHVKRRVKEQSW